MPADCWLINIFNYPGESNTYNYNIYFFNIYSMLHLKVNMLYTIML